MFKILLITVYRDYPLRLEEPGMAYIGAFMRKHGYEVLLTGGTEAEIDYERIECFKPDIIGASLYSFSREPFFKFCTKIKQRLPRAYICIGGYFPTFNYRDILKEAEFIDFAVRGEGELSFLHLVTCLENQEDLRKVKGLVYRDGKELIVNEPRELIPDLGILPMPARDFAIEKKAQFVVLSTTRGCKGECHFCLNRSFWKKWRGRSVESVLAEIEYLYGLGFKNYFFADVSFEDSDQDNYERLKGIARGIIDRGLDVTFRIDVRAEFYRKIDAGVVDLLKRAGMRILMIGIETDYQPDLELYGKIATLEDNHRSIEFYREQGVPLEFGFIVFNPYTTFEGLRQNVDFLEKYRFCFDLFKLRLRYQLTKGSKLYAKVENDGLLGDGEYYDVFNYRFADHRVGVLWEYVDGFCERVRKDMEAIYSRDFYLVKLRHLKEHLKNDARADEIISRYEEEMEIQLRDLNEKNARVFRSLVDLAETGWHETEAEKIMESIGGENYYKSMSSQLSRSSIVFLRQMALLGEEYTKLLHVFFYNGLFG